VKFKTLSIFPEFFDSATNFSLLKKAQEKGFISVESINLRDYADQTVVHKAVDDRPFGGGAGMVMMVEPVYRAIKELRVTSYESNSDLGVPNTLPRNSQPNNLKTIIFSPKGRKYDQSVAEEFAKLDELILICPHYEGFDERILNFVDEEICIGDYVLTGGEIPALAVIDSVARLIPGVLGNETSAQTESFSELSASGKRNLEHPQYTRPATFIDDEGKEYKVPDVLLSGNHKEIEKWRESNSSKH
jgi:tRNA (guanine37-N1)-methyltransferase